MLFHELEQLPDLIGFRFSADLLQIHQLRNASACENVMTAARAHVAKPERLGKLQGFGKSEVIWALQRLPKQLARIHLSFYGFDIGNSCYSTARMSLNVLLGLSAAEALASSGL